jgi:hypothetical protein
VTRFRRDEGAIVVPSSFRLERPIAEDVPIGGGAVFRSGTNSLDPMLSAHTPINGGAPMAEKDLNELFLDTLKDIYYAEKQILKALPKMAKAANSDKLRTAFEKHHDETEGHVDRLEQIFELLGKAARGKKCDAIEWTSMPTRPRSTPACWRPLKRSSITRFRDTAR